MEKNRIDSGNILRAFLNGNGENNINNVKNVINKNTNIVKYSENISIKQMGIFEKKSLQILELYKNKKVLNGSDTLLNNGEKLENYKIVVDGNYIKIVDVLTNYQYGFFSLGNNKLQKDVNTTYIIWNIPQKVSCKYKTKVCGKICYADKYPNNTTKNVIGRSKNLVLSTYENFTDIFMEVINIVNKIYNNNIFIRIHESGDFYNLEYFKKIEYIIENNVNKNIGLAYTKNMDILEYVKNRDFNNFTIRYSIMEDTHIKLQKEILSSGVNAFICTKETNINIPMCGDNCSKCLLCYKSNMQYIAVKPH